MLRTSGGHFYSARRANKGNVFVLTIISECVLCPELPVRGFWRYWCCAVASKGYSLRMTPLPAASSQVRMHLPAQFFQTVLAAY